MIIELRKGKTLRRVALISAFSLIFEMLFPTVTYALTSGPTQPEFQSFSPISADNMVDLATGDFSYSIPLIEIPGPNGGYPLNLVYNAGIGMEQEASWVGLGWNLNVGNITRDMRGTPDDFNGEEIIKTMNIKENNTYSMMLSLTDLEMLGISSEKIKGLGNLFCRFSYNTYKGFGIAAGFGLEYSKLLGGTLKGGIDFSIDSQEGINVTPNVSLSRKLSTANNALTGLSVGGGFNFNSRQGIYAFNAMADVENLSNQSMGFSASKTVKSYCPPVTMPMAGFNQTAKVKLGPSALGTTYNLTPVITVSTQHLASNTGTADAYGMLYLQNSTAGSIAEINREKESEITPETRNLPVPILTNDMYTINAHGIGGSFTTRRSDIGMFHDQTVEQQFFGGTLGAEIGTGAGTEFGTSFSTSFTKSSTGGWTAGNYTTIGFKNYESSGIPKLYEPGYYAMEGEFLAHSDTQLKSFLEMTPSRIVLSTTNDGKPVSNRFLETDQKQPTIIQNTVADKRKKRLTHVGYLTNAEAAELMVGCEPIFIENQQDHTFNYSAQPASQVGVYQITDPSGMQYQFGIPVYNLEQKEVMFAIAGSTDEINKRQTDYGLNDASISNNNGTDNYYSATEIPQYAYSYLLTSIQSADYVDITGNGPTDDDFGYWVNFKYKKINDYYWRIPYKNANYIIGNASDPIDDKASYSYGKKEMYYPDTILTKTHKAVFYTSERADGKGVSTDEYNDTVAAYIQNPPPSGQLKLDSIKLFSRMDESQPVVTVHFRYGYDLCKNVDNNGTTGDGKLTLTELWFTYGTNSKGMLNPYRFEYSSGLGNPDYTAGKMDRWGNYSADGILSNPYTDQNDREAADIAAGAWSLSKIDLPSGGSIIIEYECDDYAYVQDRRATQMFKIKGIADVSQFRLGLGNKLKIYFDSPPGYQDFDKKDFWEGFEDNLMYFKVYCRLKKNPGSNPKTYAWEYIDGFATIDSVGVDGNGYYAAVKQVNYKERGSVRKAHPFQMAGWQELKLKRSDLLYGSPTAGGGLANMAESMVGMINDVFSSITGYYAYCNGASFCDQISSTTSTPSFIRLNNPVKKKLGGGHRVKRLIIADNWTRSEESFYAIKYRYETSEAYNNEQNYRVISSGVAEYEPMVGNEENALRYPEPYTRKTNLIGRKEELFLEKPFGEGYFPGPRVVYSKVIVQNVPLELDGQEFTEVQNVKKSADGISVTEHYTARDFPIKSTYTAIERDRAKYEKNPIIRLPFIKHVEKHYNGLSQGYVIELNDMHGKLKSQATYKPGIDVLDITKPVSPLRKTEYFYKTDDKGELSSKVQTLRYDDQILLSDLGPDDQLLDNGFLIQNKTLGLDYDIVIDWQENSTYNENLGLEPNFNQLVTSVPFIIPSLIPERSESDDVLRTMVMAKIIKRKGIVDRVVAIEDGARVETQNLLYDEETGQVLLSMVNNEYGNMVYTFNYPAYWFYDGMAPAYQNWGATINSFNNNPYTIQSHTTNSSAITLPPDFPAESVFQTGDMLLHSYSTQNAPTTFIHEKLWVMDFVMTDVDKKVIVTTENNQPAFQNFLNSSIRVIKSGHTNQQSTGCGTIVSLKNPVTEMRFSLFDAFNALPNTSKSNPYTFTDQLGIERTAYSFFDDDDEIQFDTVSISEEGNPCFTFESKSISDLEDIAKLQLFGPGKVLIILDNANSDTLVADIIRNCGFRRTLDGVLDANATEYNNQNWVYDYLDAGFSVYNPVDQYNKYRAGKEGIWRMYMQHAFLTQRKQTGTHANATRVNQDGTYEQFFEFDWGKGITNPSFTAPGWRWTEKVTQYNPYGFAVESKNALDIYSSALYGYGSSLATAVAQNASYYEIAFDGFEDYPQNNTSLGHNHMNITNTSGVAISGDVSHTGKKALKLAASGTLNINFWTSLPSGTDRSTFIMPKKKYLLSGWFYASQQPIQVTAIAPPTSGVILNTTMDERSIEGWRRFEVEIMVTSSAPTTFIISIAQSGVSEAQYAYFDDLRVRPFNSSFTSYVYDPLKFRLVAQLDDNNYASFYNYDEEGTLVQTKKETERGIVTIKTTRQHLKGNSQ